MAGINRTDSGDVPAWKERKGECGEETSKTPPKLSGVRNSRHWEDGHHQGFLPAKLNKTMSLASVSLDLPDMTAYHRIHTVATGWPSSIVEK